MRCCYIHAYIYMQTCIYCRYKLQSIHNAYEYIHRYVYICICILTHTNYMVENTNRQVPAAVLKCTGSHKSFENDTLETNGSSYKSWGKCRLRLRPKCEHNRRRSECKDCGGSQICEHNRTRSRCKECGGSQICEHNRTRSTCKDCGGGSICEHNRTRSMCKECGGASICEHNRTRSRCKD